MTYSSTKIVEGYYNVCIQNTNQNKFLNYPLNKYSQFKNSSEFTDYLAKNHFSFKGSIKDSFFKEDRSFKESFQIPYTYQVLLIEGQPILKNLKKLLENGITIHSLGIINKVSLEWISQLSKIISNSCVNNVEFNYGYQQTVKTEICSILNSCYCSFNSIENDSIIIFINNHLFFNEANLYNPYYNSKILLKSPGVIYDSIVNGKKLSFNKSEIKNEIWYSSKSKIDVCKDCEYRYMCLDKRLPVRRTSTDWFYIQECNYNPYIAKWKGQKDYHTLSECGVISNENGFSIDHEKIATINQQLWGE